MTRTAAEKHSRAGIMLRITYRINPIRRPRRWNCYKVEPEMWLAPLAAIVQLERRVLGVRQNSGRCVQDANRMRRKMGGFSSLMPKLRVQLPSLFKGNEPGGFHLKLGERFSMKARTASACCAVPAAKIILSAS